MGKGLAVWVFGSLTFVAVLHVLEAFFALTQNVPVTLPRLYPFSDWFGTVDVVVYFWGSLIAVLLFWGLTCIVALRSPLDMLLSRILKDAELENEEEVSILSAKGNFLETMNESLIHNTIEINTMKDLLQNVRVEVVNMRPVVDVVERVKSDLTSVKTTLKKLETNMEKKRICPACGRDVQSDFRICPYCGENLLTAKVLLAEPAVIKVQR